MKLKKKSISPLIATVLLIVVSVILVVVVLTWGKDFVGESLEETKIFYQESDLTGFVVSQDVINKHVVIFNNSQQDINIVGFRLIVPFDNQFYNILNHNDFVLDNIFISSKTTKSIYLHCFPSSNFGLDLLLDNNTFVRVNVNVRNYTDDLCSIYKSPVKGLVFRENFEDERDVYIKNEVVNNVIFDNGSGNFNGENSKINIYKINLGNLFSIRTKIKVNVIDKTHGIIGNKIGLPNEYEYFGIGVVNKFRLSNANNNFVDSNLIVSADTWYEVVVVVQNNFCEIYIDGVLDNSGSINISKFNVEEIGKFWSVTYPSSYWLDGTINFIELYNSALTPEEVSLLYGLS